MNENVVLKPGEARCDAESYQDILDQDTREVPWALRQEAAPFLGDEPLSVDRFIDPNFFKLEVQKMWPRVWQMACREEDIPEVGDYTVYENVGMSFLVARTAPDKIQAFYNSCLHRGRKLKTQEGCANQFRCPFHGLTWNLDGSFKENPTAWDFPHMTKENSRLPEARTGTWGGFVFINPNKDAPDLETVLGPLVKHFERWRLEDCYKFVHVGKVVPANWKITSEAFMESFHSVDTHPQIMPFLACANSQYDVFSDYITRQISANAIPSPHLDASKITQQEILDEMTGGAGRRGGAEAGLQVPDGMTARAFMAEVSRQAYNAEDGNDYSDKSDAEMLDAILYNCFPNISVWGGFLPNIVYRWRPNGMDVDSALMEVIWLKRCPKDGPRPQPVPFHMLGEDEPWTAAEELGGLAEVFEQDMANLPFVQDGMKASGTGVVNLGNYQEMRVRQHHIMLDRYINGEL